MTHLHPLASIHASTLAPVDETITHAGASVLIGEAFRAIVAERMQQVQKHGRTIGNDMTYTPDVLPLAAASYLNAAIDQLTSTRATGPDLAAPDTLTWPFSDEAWRPGTVRANLVKANALIWAAIDRIDHAPSETIVAARTCRDCGCTDERACMDGDQPCSWIAPDLCSACEPVSQAAVA